MVDPDGRDVLAEDVLVEEDGEDEEDEEGRLVPVEAVLPAVPDLDAVGL